MIIVPIDISARHVHLSPADWRQLFSTDGPTVAKLISEPPQFIAAERVSIETPDGLIENVGVVGPLRAYTQVELAMTDARRLGVEPPLSDSGHLSQAVEITIRGPQGSIRVAAAIIQQRHIHASPVDAQNYGLTDGQQVSVVMTNSRGGRFDHVLVRIAPDYVWRMHIDTDEGNALGVLPGTTGEVLLS